MNAYIANRGRQWRRPRLTLSLPICEKWTGLVPATFVPNWLEVWTTGHPRKEAAFLGSFYHKAIVVNQWRHIAHPTTSNMCTCCDTGLPESFIHGFFEYEAAREAWSFATTVIHRLLGHGPDTMPWPQLSWQQCLLDFELPRMLCLGHNTWSLIRGCVIWVIWIRRNAAIFKNTRWPTAQLDWVMWDAIGDLARSAWMRVLQLHKSQLVGGP